MIVDDPAIRELNRQYLGQDRATDVISFPGDDDLLGEIVCSVDTAKRQARSRDVPLIDELKLLAVHGLLHLMGHDDLNERAWRRMKIAEFEQMVKIL
jgi:rRNA maturation RNase YbeY